MKKVLFSVFLLLSFHAVFSQAITRSIFIEAGGPGLLSANIDMRFSKKEDGIGGRIGIGGFNGIPVLHWSLPLEVNWLLQMRPKHKLELGGGITFVTDLGVIVEPNPDVPYTPPSAYDKFIENFKTTHGHLSLGYRYQPKAYGLYFRAAVTPIISKDFIPFFGGVSMGYKFKNDKKVP